MKRIFSGTKEELEKDFVQNGLLAKEVAPKYGVKKSCILYWAKKLGIKIPGRGGRNIKDLCGQRFGYLTVIEKDCYLPGRGEAKWICKCDCGNKVSVVGKSLRHSATRSCGCLRHNLCYHGYKDLSGCYWHRVKKGAVKRGLEFSITLQDAWEQYEKQNKQCALTGIPIYLTTDYTRNKSFHTASLDRIDSSKGYIVGNIQWLHKDVNIMKNNHTQDTFIDWCKKIAMYCS